jgi:hypothetical protein
MSVQEMYWLVGIAVGLIATAINIALFRRNRPDTVKLAVQQAIEPLIKRMDKMETTHNAQGQEITSQGRALARIETDLKHMPQRDEFNQLHTRLTDLVRDTSELRGAGKAEGLLLDRINQFLIRGQNG